MSAIQTTDPQPAWNKGTGTFYYRSQRNVPVPLFGLMGGLDGIMIGFMDGWWQAYGRRTILVSILCVVVVGWIVHEVRDPRVDGRRLSGWIEELYGGEKELAVKHLLGYGSGGADRIFDEATRKDGIVQKWRWRLPASLRNRIPQARSQVYRLEKICQLVELYPEAFQPFSDRLGKWMRDENPIIKAQAMRLLRMYPATAKELETKIVQAVSETGPGYVNGILLLETMGASHETMISVIQSGFESDDYRLRARAVEMAQRMGLAPGLVVPVLRSIIEYGPFDAAFHAIGLAGKVGPTASELIPVIEQFSRTVPNEVSQPPGLVEQTLRWISGTNEPDKNIPDFEKK